MKNQSLRIATWNVNSVRPRLEQLLAWLSLTKPDIVLLQETKVVDELFPREPIEDLGYNLTVHGQKTYNGVAILSKFSIEDVQRGLPNFDDPQARYLEAFTGGLRVASVYVPNGQAPGTEKFSYKLAFMQELTQHIRDQNNHQEIMVVGGDYNITVDDDDVYDPVAWHEQILCSSEERRTLRTLLNAGLHDALAIADARSFTWWDYRQGAFPKDHGLRIDHLLISAPAVDCLEAAGVDRDVRANQQPSDHAPVWCRFNVS